MPHYQTAPQSVATMAQELIRRNFPDLQEVDTTFCFLFAFSPTDDAGRKPPAVTHGGYPAAATIRQTSYKDRVSGLADVVVTIDGEMWEGMTDRQREALLHHEASHLELKRSEDGSPQVDDAGRPKFKMRKHDFQIGVFKSTMEKYGPDSLDLQVVSEAATWVQETIKWG
jgi:hypothetical protein